MDGRVLPVLLGITGHPPRTYRIPVPAPDGGPPTVLVYRRVPHRSSRTGPTRGWKYLHDPTGQAGRRRPAWPWSRPAPGPDDAPQGKPDGADG